MIADQILVFLEFSAITILINSNNNKYLKPQLKNKAQEKESTKNDQFYFLVQS